MIPSNIYKALKHFLTLNIITFQQYNTLKGQANAGNVGGAWKGLHTILKKQQEKKYEHLRNE